MYYSLCCLHQRRTHPHLADNFDLNTGGATYIAWHHALLALSLTDITQPLTNYNNHGNSHQNADILHQNRPSKSFQRPSQSLQVSCICNQNHAKYILHYIICDNFCKKTCVHLNIFYKILITHLHHHIHGFVFKTSSLQPALKLGSHNANICPRLF